MWKILLGYYTLLSNHTYLCMQSCGSVSFRTCSIIFILEPLFDSPDVHQIFTTCTISPIIQILLPPRKCMYTCTTLIIIVIYLFIFFFYLFIFFFFNYITTDHLGLFISTT